jgi:hypothetical protein
LLASAFLNKEPSVLNFVSGCLLRSNAGTAGRSQRRDGEVGILRADASLMIGCDIPGRSANAATIGLCPFVLRTAESKSPSEVKATIVWLAPNRFNGLCSRRSCECQLRHLSMHGPGHAKRSPASSPLVSLEVCQTERLANRTSAT